MDTTNQMRFFLSQFVPQPPVVLVCLVAGVVIFAKWKQASPSSLWALLGFGLTLILCFIIPIAQVGVQNEIMHGDIPMSRRVPLFAGLSFLWAMLRAVSYALLLVAVFTGRSPERPTSYPF